MRRELAQKSSIALSSLLVSVSCLLIVILIVFKLPEASTGDREMGFYPTIKSRKVSQNAISLGKFGEMMVEMLPQDLAFTVFVPSEEAFNRDLHLLVNDSLVPEKFDDTYATISRILSFSAVPRALSSVNVPFGEHVSYDSLSGFPLYISKDIDGTLVVNRVRSEVVDVKKKEILIHVMDGVIMDADFEESVLLDNTEDSEEDSLQ
ncbi:hypothetical protein L6164_030046 [Bauhinia variegata]|uniref:Uncharacterized protein n=1 Tax=Bauhinia variegata TaxID=167791 RepID=A0ACB9LB61_BAUVA|nr:hypothetical protein L6164_030046 [Bauhinia variegata]